MSGPNQLKAWMISLTSIKQKQTSWNALQIQTIMYVKHVEDSIGKVNLEIRRIPDQYEKDCG